MNTNGLFSANNIRVHSATKILFYNLLQLYAAAVNSSNKIVLTFDIQCVTVCTGSPDKETSIDQLTSQLTYH